MKSEIYFDNAATTRTRKEVVNSMLPYFSENYGNPSSIYKLGSLSRSAVNKSREAISKNINADSSEITFTSGGTESDNMALRGFLSKSRGKVQIITSKIEHSAVLKTVNYLEKEGYEIVRLPVDKYGIVNPNDVSDAISEKTAIVSIMHVNNEIGTVEPINEIGKICHDNNVPFHTDAVQSFGKIKIDVKEMNIDLLSASSHKLYGPKGIGLLYIRKELKPSFRPLIVGGGQEFKLRSGTENVPGIVGFSKAVELAHAEMEKENKRIVEIRDYLIKGVLKISNSWLNGHPTKRISGNAHFCFDGAEGEAIVMLLNSVSIYTSSGSACSSASLSPSHVLSAIGLKAEDSHGSLRISLGRENTLEEVDKFLFNLKKIIKRLREMNPLESCK